MRQIGFSQDDIKQLSYQSIHHPHPMVRRRMQALLLKSQGMPHKEIGLYLNISQTTLRKYFDLYLSGGVAILQQLHYQGKTNHLLQQQEVIVAAMEANLIPTRFGRQRDKVVNSYKTKTEATK